MKRLAFALAATVALALPVAAESLAILLPRISFPDDAVTSSSKGCDATTTTAACTVQK